MSPRANLETVLKNEFELRDYIANHIEELEKGLRVLKKEYELSNARGGAGGRTDILAADALDHVVVIEVKRSDSTAREAIHELSKYVSLLIERDRVPRELIRCVVVSTAWHELELSLSYFRATAQVDVIGLEPYIEGNELKFRKRNLFPVATLPQFSPEFSIYRYEDKSKYGDHINKIKSQAENTPFVRLASCLFEPSPFDDETCWLAIMCLWRIQPRNYESLEKGMGKSIGHLHPYAFPEWEAECDCLNWLGDETSDNCTIFYSAESERGTPEKARSISSTRNFVQIDRIGDWPKLEIVNTVERVLSQITAVTGITGSPRHNRHQFSGVASPQFLPSWIKTKDEFIHFLRAVPEWQSFARGVGSDLERHQNLKVEFSAFDKKHFFYALHQCTEHEDTGLSSFSIVAHDQNKIIFVAEGSWDWDGSHTFGVAKDEIKKIFGSTEIAVLSLFSAVDENRYEGAYTAHGFKPYIRILESIQNDNPVWEYELGSDRGRFSLMDFVQQHKDYVMDVSRELCLCGKIPTSPSAT